MHDKLFGETVYKLFPVFGSYYGGIVLLNYLLSGFWVYNFMGPLYDKVGPLFLPPFALLVTLCARWGLC